MDARFLKQADRMVSSEVMSTGELLQKLDALNDSMNNELSTVLNIDPFMVVRL